jgi:hypothetical protein
MVNKMRVFSCKSCKIDFSISYRISVNKEMSFCSKSCKTKYQRNGFYNKTQLENSIIKSIKEEGKYLTIDDICHLLKISSKTLVKFRISTLSLNKKSGFKKSGSVFEEKCFNILKEKYGEIETQKMYDDCVSDKGHLLRYDFYIPSENILVEADGKQHFNLAHVYSSEYTIKCDEIKDIYAKLNNIKLIRIPYTRNVNKDYIYKLL